MKPLRRAAFLEAGSPAVLLAALLLLAGSAPALAGERGRPNDSSGPERIAVPNPGPSAPSRGSSGPSRVNPPSPPPSPPSVTPGSPSAGRGPRTAVPQPGGVGDPHRQRRDGSRDRWDGPGWYGYGPHYPRYYYYGPYWGWGLSWWWDDYLWYSRGPYGYYDRYDRYGRYDRYDRYGTMGAIDTDVAPGRTQVWLDGRYIGTVDDFDGFPQYLWLDKGTYDLVLFLDGYQTIARQISIYPGTVISVDDRLERGESVRPEDLATKTHERRDTRIREEEQRRGEVARREREAMEDWRDRARRRMEEPDPEEDDRAAEFGDAGRLYLEVEPADASVYLDGRFVGTGSDLERLRRGLRLEPGEHRVAVVRPGHRAEEREITVGPGQEVDLEIELESME